MPYSRGCSLARDQICSSCVAGRLFTAEPTGKPKASLMAQMGKTSACNVGDLGSVPGLERSSRAENDNPLQYSGLKNSMDKGAWQATLYGVTKSQTQLSNFLGSMRTMRSRRLRFVLLLPRC